VLAQASKGVLVAAPHMYVTIPTRSIVQRNIIEPFGPGREEKKIQSWCSSSGQNSLVHITLAIIIYRRRQKCTGNHGSNSAQREY
jgi:hypothetical protein